MTDYAPEFLLGAFVGEGNIETFLLGSGTVNPGDMVSLSSSAASAESTVVPATNGGVVIGVVQRVYTAMGITWVSCVVRGKVKMTAGGAISIGAPIQAGGQSVVVAGVRTVTIPSGATAVDSTSAQPSMTVGSGICFGVALQAASANGDVILCSIMCAQ